ncbi:MAG: cytochrome c biogenesis protein CcsA, partial [Nitrospirae bacterium]|nr:cytochrome c biogenesis protein CcsA [Nitrospirota bacterium]
MTILALSFASYLFVLWKKPLLYPALVLQIVYIFTRGAELGRLPLVGPHDTLIFLSASMAAFSIVFAFALKDRCRFLNTTAVIAAVFTAFAMTAAKHNSPLPPVLKTFWFECHVVLAFMSYALFGIAAVFGGVYLSDRQSSFEGLGYRAVLIGYCLFTLSMIFGGIWAYLAWGTYWIWTPKELWTTILWAYYSFYLHAWLRPWWPGRPMAVLGIAGFA